MFRQRPGDSDRPAASTGPSGLRTPSVDNTTYALIFLIVFVPIIFTIILCTITYCVYRRNKKRSARSPTNSPIVPTDRSGAPIATIIYNTQHNPYIFEESPPTYDSLTETKKDPNGLTTTTTNEQIQLTMLPNTTLTNANGEVTTGATLPTAPTPPPPFYINLNESNK